MATPSLTEKEELLDRQPTPHLSYSQINRYLTCPEQYRLYYVERLRSRIESGAMVFGALAHVALADFFRDGCRPGRDLPARMAEPEEHRAPVQKP